ncbi:unnamed protein product [Lactuca virosa]|uniref:Secreted protein n=1 Tax=Lactuca virosa TaxID=75947 RepID=A0AAU9LK82_9ASTR|nr:unnamed protein product [Lactuca virosa]
MKNLHRFLHFFQFLLPTRLLDQFVDHDDSSWSSSWSVMSSRSRRNQPGGRPDFPWYTFPRIVSLGVLSKWNRRLEWMKQRKVHAPAVVD